MAKTHVSTKDSFPMQKHWAILKFTSIHIPGDERSRTHPGHGYPAHNQEIVEYVAFDSEEEWLEEIKVLEGDSYRSNKNYRAIVVEPVQVTTEVKINVGS